MFTGYALAHNAQSNSFHYREAPTDYSKMLLAYVLMFIGGALGILALSCVFVFSWWVGMKVFKPLGMPFRIGKINRLEHAMDGVGRR